MNDDRYKKIYDLAIQLQNQNYEKEYKRLLELDNNMGTLEDYISSEIKKCNSKNPSKNKNKNYILKDQIVKDNIMINMYLIHLKHIEPVQLDENYKVLPLEEKDIYQYGTLITMEINEGYINLDDIFADYKNEEEVARKEYEKLKNNLLKLSKEELLNEIENTIKKDLNL